MCNCGSETFASDFNDQFCEPTGVLLSLSGKQDIVGDVNVRAKEPSDLNAAKSKAHFEQVNLIISLSTHVAGDTLLFPLVLSEIPLFTGKGHLLNSIKKDYIKIKLILDGIRKIYIR